MVDAVSKIQGQGLQKQAGVTLDQQLNPALLKAATEKAPTLAKTEVKLIAQDLHAAVNIAKQEKSMDRGSLDYIDKIAKDAARSGSFKGHAESGLLQRYKEIVEKANKDQAYRKSSSKNPKSEDRHHKHHDRYHVAGNADGHDLLAIRHELMAMVLANKQLQPGSKTLKQQAEEKGEFIDPNLSAEDALAERIRLLLDQEGANSPSQQDRGVEEGPDIDLLTKTDVDNAFSNELRGQSQFGFLDTSPGLGLLLDGVVDITPYIVARESERGGKDSTEIAAEVFQFQQFVEMRRKKRRGGNGLVTDEDCETLLLVQYLPMLYDAVHWIMQQNLDPESIAKMESLKGELAALIQSAADPNSAIHTLFKEIKDSLQDREMQEWTG